MAPLFIASTATALNEPKLIAEILINESGRNACLRSRDAAKYFGTR